MNPSFNSPSWSTLMKDNTDFNDQSSVIFRLWDKYHKTKNEFHQVDQSCQSFIQIKQSINSNVTIEDLEQICRQHESQKWVSEFTKNLPNCTTNPTTTKLDPEKASASLISYFDKAFWNSFGILLFYSLHSLFQSYKAWNLINSFHIPSYENQIRRTSEKLNECARICHPLIDLETLNQDQMRKLQRVQELLRDIKDTIQFVIDDVTNKIIQAESIVQIVIYQL